MNTQNIMGKCALVIALSCSSLVAAVDYSELVTLSNGYNDALSVDSEGNIYVSRAGPFGSTGLSGLTIQKITPDGNVSEIAAQFDGPVAHDFDSNGNMYVINFNSGIIDKITQDGAKSVFGDFSNHGNDNGILIKDNDDIYVTSYINGTIYKVTSSGVIEKWVSGNGLNGPVGIVTDEDDNIYVGNYEDGRVFKISTDKVFTELTSSTGGSGYIVYAEGMIYATGINTNKIYQIPTNGGSTIELPGSSKAGLIAPNGIAISNDGTKLYVSNYSSVKKIMVIENFIDDGSTNPQANNDTVTVSQDSVVTIEVLSNDTVSNIALDVSSIYLVTAVQNGTTLVDDTTGNITYTPTIGYSGEDSFVYTVENTQGETSNEASVSITVSKVTATPQPTPTAKKSSGGSFGYVLFMMCLVLARKNR